MPKKQVKRLLVKKVRVKNTDLWGSRISVPLLSRVNKNNTSVSWGGIIWYA